MPLLYLALTAVTRYRYGHHRRAASGIATALGHNCVYASDTSIGKPNEASLQQRGVEASGDLEALGENLKVTWGTGGIC